MNIRKNNLWASVIAAILIYNLLSFGHFLIYKRMGYTLGLHIALDSITSMIFIIGAVLVHKRHNQVNDAAVSEAAYRKRAEDAEKTIRDIIDALPFGIAVIDNHGTLIENNRMWQWFRPDVSFTGSHYKGIYDSMDNTSSELPLKLFQGIEKVIAGLDTDFEMEFSSVLHPSEWYNLRVKKFDCNGSDMTIVIREDITQRRSAENALYLSELRLRRITNNMIDMISEMDSSLKLIYVSDSYKSILGYEPDDLLGRTATELIHPDDITKTVNTFREAHANRIPAKIEVRSLTSRGDYIWTELLGRCIVNEKNEFMGVICSGRDIDERKGMEEQIRYLSFHDKVTGLYNRAFFEEELRRLDTDRQLPLSIVIGDVNGLKLANDAFGHEEGDNLLNKIGRLLRLSCRSSDLVARWGGDEFAILLPRTEGSAALDICARIMAACEQSEPYPVKPSIALGAATKYEPYQDIQEIIKDAESWMYKHKLVESKSVRSSIILSLRKTLAEKNIETDEHVTRAQKLALRLARAAGLSDNQLDEIALLAILHDMGKVAIPDSILAKPGALTNDEWDIIKKHSEIGYRIADASHELAHIADGILAHHEQWDGSGYPQGLAGRSIPLTARVLAIVDAYDVMTHDRVYKKAISKGDALAEIQRCAGSQFDPKLVDAFITMMKDATTV